jgi:hypothetical protein
MHGERFLQPVLILCLVRPKYGGIPFVFSWLGTGRFLQLFFASGHRALLCVFPRKVARPTNFFPGRAWRGLFFFRTGPLFPIIAGLSSVLRGSAVHGEGGRFLIFSFGAGGPGEAGGGSGGGGETGGFIWFLRRERYPISRTSLSAPGVKGGGGPLFVFSFWGHGGGPPPRPMLGQEALLLRRRLTGRLI